MANTNPFLPSERETKHTENLQITDIRERAFELLKRFPVGAPNASTAKRKLTEAVMWAVKDITA